MVTDRVILISNGRMTVELTQKPYSVEKIKGFDRLQVQIVTSQGFDQVGASLLNDYILPRDMEISGQIYGDTTEKMQNLRDELLSLFIPKTDITINHYYGGKNRLITARVEESPEFGFSEVTRVQNYNVHLLAAEPYWRDVSETLIQMANIKGGFHFPLRIPVDRGIHFGVKSASLIANIHNRSPVKTGMKIVFVANGDVVNPQLFNVNTREYIRLLCSMENGDQITIETGDNKTITRVKNGIAEDYMGKIDLSGGNTFLELFPGDNLFRYLSDEGQDMLEIKIYYYNKYLGV